MKELSIEEKAKAYDEAKARISRAYNSNRCTIGFMNEIFPEFLESEDERIKKSLIHLVRIKGEEFGFIDANTSVEKALAWLEKQGENSVCKVKIGETYKCIASPRYTCFRMGDIYHVKDNFVAELINICSDCFVLLEKQGEQKHAVETKLKIEKGKWYVCVSQFSNCIKGRVYKATSDSRIMDDFGTEYDMHSDAYKYFRLWTIQDAKDGDVLAAHECYVIFKEIDGLNIKCYCTYHYLGFNPSFYVDTLQNKLAFQPATKEQRDTLMKAMADAGYAFDFEKKELKKVEQKFEENPSISLTDFKKAFELKAKQYDIKLPNRGYDIHAMCEELYSLLIKQKPAAWSEEDEEIYRRCICSMRASACGFPEEEKFVEQVDNWINSFKDRIQPKQEWSEEDENGFPVEKT